MPKNILFISESFPNMNSFGSEVIFYRHLKYFEDDGYKIILITSQRAVADRINLRPHPTWEIYKLFSDDYIPLWFVKRFRIIAHYIYLFEFVLRNIGKPMHIFSNLWGVRLCTFSSFLAKHYKCKVTYFVHDDNRQFTDTKNLSYIEKINKYCVDASSKLLCVTYELGNSIVLAPKSKYKIFTLLPIPEGTVFNNIEWERNFKKKIVFAGSIYKDYFNIFLQLNQILEPLNGELLLISNNIKRYAKIIKTLNLSHTKIQEAKQENQEALLNLHQSKSILLIGYSENVEHLKFSFPSKLLEYSYLGLPCLLIAPRDTAFYKWIISNTNFEIFDPSEKNAIEFQIKYLFTAEGWYSSINELIRIRELFFNPKNIHKTIPL